MKTSFGRPTSPALLSRAQRAYCELLVSSSSRERSFDELCLRRPELAAELRAVAESRASLFEDSAGDPVDPGFALKLLEKYQDVLLSETDSAGGDAESRQQLPLVPSLERYELHEEIGRGGMGAVFQVTDRNLTRPLAMKVVLGAPSSNSPEGPPVVSSARLRRFLAEAQITGQLEHPGIVPVHELGIDEADRVYLTMRRVQGRELGEIFQLAREGAEGWNRTRMLGALLQVCETVAYAHRRGVVHRDLKPANVLVGDHGEVYVMDWGLARVAGSEEAPDGSIAIDGGGSPGSSPLQTRDGAVLGTPAYMSPEQALGQVEMLGPRTDVYSLGALLYTGLTGHVPHPVSPDADTPLATLQQIVGEDPVPIARLEPATPPELISICEKAMEREPGKRYADPLELVKELRAFLEGRVVRAHDRGPWAQLRKWFQRNRLFALSISALPLVAIGVLIMAWRLQLDYQQVLARFGDGYQVRQLARELEGGEFWVAHPLRIQAMEGWWDRAEELRANLPEHRRSNQELRSSLGPRVLAYEGSPTFASLELSPGELGRLWEYETSSKILEELEEFFEEGGAFDRAEREREWVHRIHGESITDHAEEWRSTIATIAASEMYGGREIRPQVGLVPIGFDPDSGLAEFAHLLTARREVGPDGELGPPILPLRNAEDRFDAREDLPLIFVLLPGGTCRIGAWPPGPGRPPGAPNVDPGALPDEAPVLEVELDPFFISKFEMTQGQYRRLTDPTPSSPRLLDGPDQSVRPDLPVADINQEEAGRPLVRHFLILPTEAQWEYAARAGCAGIWETGDDEESLHGAANLSARLGADPYPFASPVGRFPANRFGLHDVHGNVAEHCLDTKGSYYFVPEPGAGRRFPATGEYCVRGGSYVSEPSETRLAWRGDAGERGPMIGVRPARHLDPERYFAWLRP